jgi:hypothetical protein
MKTRPQWIVAALAAALLAGCQSSGDPGRAPGGYTIAAPKTVFGYTSSLKLADLRIGMTKEEVQSVLGPPDSTSAEAKVEYMTYYLELPAHVAIYDRHPRYMVRLVNGRVESFGRFVELFDLYVRPVDRAAPAPRLDLASELARLKALREQGSLTDGEFERAKAIVLARP